MARGQIAKETITKKIIAAFGDDYLGEKDKKLIIQAPDEGGSMIQIAITLTCPKADIITSSGPVIPTTTPTPVSTELTPDEKATIARLIDTLSL